MKVKSDGFIGTVMASEGISDATTLLHGPDGCRKNLASLSSKVYYRPPQGRFTISTPYYHGMPRVPCTGVISTDYIVGAQKKLADALKFVGGYEKGLITVVCTPGASLIGDDQEKSIREAGLEGRVVCLDSGLISKSCGEGMDRTLQHIADSLIESSWAAPKEEGTVNVLGLNVLTKDWRSVRKEFDEILGLMGLKVTCYLGAGCTTEEIRRSATAEYNIVVAPEYSRVTAEFYQERFGIPSVTIGYAPVGFDAVFSLIDKISEVTGRDASRVKEYIGAYAERAYRCMNEARIDVKGRTFAIDADPSIAYPLTVWLHDSLALVPASVRFNGEKDDFCQSSLSTFLQQNRLDKCLEAAPPEFTDYMICDGNTAQLYELSKHCRRGLDVCFPSIQNVDFRESPVIGCRGAMYLLDRIMNAF